MAKSKKETKENVFAHSQAKLEFYKNYLAEYLVVLLNNPYTDTINIYDIFCGIGIYKDGNEGSPIIAIKNIKSLLKEYPSKNINLTLNDKDESKIDFVTNYIEKNYKNICEVNSYNLDAIEMLKIVDKKIKASKKGIKNLVFIDPYGYKEIYKKDIVNIMNSENSEIIIFLPISQMYRFSKIALTDKENKSYQPLRRFIEEFFQENHSIHNKTYVNQLEYINDIKEALSFENRYYSASYHIHKEKKDYYALFFITNHIYGLEKILDTKWKLDDLCGEGFKKTTQQFGLFNEEFKSEKKDDCFSHFKLQLKIFLKEFKTNVDLYKFTLKMGFRPTHVVEILKTEELIFDREVRKNSFYINYTNYKEKNIKYKVRIQ